MNDLLHKNQFNKLQIEDTYLQQIKEYRLAYDLLTFSALNKAFGDNKIVQWKYLLTHDIFTIFRCKLPSNVWLRLRWNRGCQIS